MKIFICDNDNSEIFSFGQINMYLRDHEENKYS